MCKEAHISHSVNCECITSQDELNESLQTLANLLDSSIGKHFKV